MTSSSGPLLTRGMLSVGCTALVFDNRDDTSQVFMLRMEKIWREKRFCDIIFNVDGEKVQCDIYMTLPFTLYISRTHVQIYWHFLAFSDIAIIPEVEFFYYERG